MVNRLPSLAWLEERTEFASLPPETLAAIAEWLTPHRLAKGEVLGEGDLPSVYVLVKGELTGPPGQGGLSPGAVINLGTWMGERPLRHQFIAQTECDLWRLSPEAMETLLADYPGLGQIFSQQLMREVQDLSAQLAYEQERQRILLPYLVPGAKRAIMGKSRYAKELREKIKRAGESRSAVLLFGEPGLEKDNMAALIHFGETSQTQEVMVKIQCASLTPEKLWGTPSQPGILDALGSGTLLLNNIQELDPNLLPAIAELIQTGTYRPQTLPGEPLAPEKISSARIIAIAETIIPTLTPLFAQTIKIPPLRVRKADIDDYSNYYLDRICRSRGVALPQLAPEALRRLQAYDFPNNVRELENLIERSVIQLQGDRVITEEIIWPSQGKKLLFRLNLLNRYPWLRQFLRSPWWPDRLNYGITAWVYPIIVATLLWGPQTRDQNFALNLFWAWWWPGILLAFLFVGRLWCAVCPFMIYGEITQKLSLWIWPRTLKKWPRQWADTWGGWLLFGLFALILLWEALWNLENTAYLSAWLLLIITAGAMICSVIFENRFWCRYLCPIGGMNGLFAKMAITELRAQQGTCSAECTTYQCYKGGPAKGEGQETTGCPLGTHPAQLTDNRDCVLCMTCLKACPHRSVAVNLRPPAIDLVTTHTPRWYEAALLLLLLNSVFLRRLPEFKTLWPFPDTFGSEAGLAVALLFLPALLPGFAYGLIPTPQGGQKLPWVQLTYGFLPLTLAANFAHYLHLGLGEAGQVLTLIPRTYGWSWLATLPIPSLVTDSAAIAFLQGLVLIGGLFWSIFLTQLLGKQSFWQLLPQHGVYGVLFGALWWAIVRG